MPASNNLGDIQANDNPVNPADEKPLRARLSEEKRALLASRLSAAARIAGANRESSGFVEVQPDPANRYEPFALNPIQQAYVIGRSPGLELGGIACQGYDEVEIENWNRERFEAALGKLIERHEMLRCIVLPDGEQRILARVPQYKVAVEDLRGLDSASVTARLESTRTQMCREVPGPEQWPLFDIRASLLDDQKTRLHFRVDLLIVDGRSLEIFFGELKQLYDNPEAALPPLHLSFRDYVSALDALERTEIYRKSKAYWTKRIPELLPSPELPLAKNPTVVTEPVFQRRSARIDADTWRTLKERGSRFQTTPSGILLAAYAEVLAIWSKTPRFTLNLTIFNRLPFHPQANEILGDFTSINLLEVDNSQPEPFAQRAQRQKAQLWADLDHRYFSGIQVLQEITRLARMGPKAVMPVVFTSLLDLDDKAQASTGARKLGEAVCGITQTPQIYLDFMAEEDKGALVIIWDAVDELFEPGMLDDMFEALQNLLLALAVDDTTWSRTLADNSRQLIPAGQVAARAQANATQAAVSDELLHTPFLRQVAERPQQLAICTPKRRLTYEETYQLACRVEKELLDRSVKPNQMVAVLMKKGWEQVVAVLGIHFAGGAYLPIDSELPAERQRYLIENGDVKIVLAQAELMPGLDIPKGVEVLAVDTMKPLAGGPPVPRRRQKPEDLAYIIYTSGSTGLPKGVMIDHRGAMNTVLDLNERFAVGPRDRVLALSRLNFDLSVYDIFGLLSAGGSIVLPAAELAQDIAHWADLIVSEKVTMWNTVPALMQLLVEEAQRGEKIGKTLRVVFMSGDWIPINLPGQIRHLLPDAKIISMGGATEASIWSILYPIEEIDPNWKSVPYGKPMVNQTFQVLDPVMAPCPVWVPGQLYIGGIGVAKGYWRDEKKTNASFIVHPATGERLYRTGDLGRYLPDGNIEFLGREDFQVKIQGYRIELGEIEARLQEYPGVENCAVIVRQDNPGEKRLVGYAVPKPGVALDVAKIREHLSGNLPNYMVPSAILVLEKFPLTANGKVDRKALPAPARAKAAATSAAPVGMLETQLIQLWEKVLGVQSIGLQDNFFDLGGTSMIAVRLFSELRKRYGKSLSLSTLFQAPTVEKLAEVLRSSGCVHSWSSLVPIQPHGDKPPFYCVHGAGGNVLMFRELAHQMQPDFPFYGLQAQGLDGSKKYLKTVEEMAAFYLEEIKQMQPEGPYYLGGFCLGGQVAFEMAQLLKKQGETVALLAMIDTYNFHGNRLDFSLLESLTEVREKVTFHFQNVVRLNFRQQLRYLAKKMKDAALRESERLVVRASNLLRIRHHGMEISDVILEHLNEEAHFAYIAAPYDGNTICFKAKQNYSYLHDPMLGWGEVLNGPLEFIELPSSAGGLFMEPYVQVLAEKLKERITDAAAKASSAAQEQNDAVACLV